MSGHTPGPWTVQRGTIDLHVYCGIDGAFSRRGLNDRAFEFSPRDFANARLIAAAPALADLLILALPSVEECEKFDKPKGPKVSRQIREALALAGQL